MAQNFSAQLYISSPATLRDMATAIAAYEPLSQDEGADLEKSEDERSLIDRSDGYVYRMPDRRTIWSLAPAVLTHIILFALYTTSVYFHTPFEKFTGYGE